MDELFLASLKLGRNSQLGVRNFMHSEFCPDYLYVHTSLMIKMLTVSLSL